MEFPRLNASIVLVHGLFGFDRISVGSYTIANYFVGIAEAMQAGGNRVLLPSLSPTGGIADRAAELRDFIRRHCPYEPLHFFAHSMGGLDCRHLISKLGVGDQALTLTTLGTPHRGSPFADWAVTKWAWLVKPTLRFLGMPDQAFYDLSVERCRRFDAETPNLPTCRYFSVAAEHDGSVTFPEWLLSYGIVKEAEGANDGVVSVASARHGEACDVWPGNHFSLVNWHDPRVDRTQTLPRWVALVERLRSLGF